MINVTIWDRYAKINNNYKNKALANSTDFGDVASVRQPIRLSVQRSPKISIKVHYGYTSKVLSTELFRFR